MGLIAERDVQFLKRKFQEVLTEDVRLAYFTQKESSLQLPGHECLACLETRELLAEVAGLSGKVHLEIHDFVANEDVAKQYKVDKIPATVFLGAAGGRLRFFGEPSGYEFATLVEDIIDVSRGATGLAEKTKKELLTLTRPVHIQVFVTPT